MRKSTEKIVQIVQRHYFSEEIDCLTDGRQVKGHSKLSNLSPVLIEGTIRVGGRIRHPPIPFDAIHPMILPRDHPVSTFIVRHFHEYLGHVGREHVLSTLRQRFCLLCPRIEWKSQPPTASHMSGIWERLIRSVRKTMKAVLGDPNAFVGLETLRKVFAEVVTILNRRPFTPISDDPRDFEPLTPSHFLLQRQNFALPPGCFEREDLYRRKQWRRAQFLADCFWKRWIREYIPTLQQRQKWTRERDNLKIEDVVLVVDNNSPRGRWLLGRVIKTFPGRDGKVCVAEIKTKTSTLTRPISKLCLLEEAV